MLPDKDGFVSIRAKDATVLQNLERYRNEFSPFCQFDGIKLSKCESLMVDSYYGQSYDGLSGNIEGIYGRTFALPAYSGDSLANYGFLRVPFKRIPRIFVRNRQELDRIISSIISFDKDVNILFRGQNKEYLLNRSPQTLMALYGDTEVLEPSLIPSSLRQKINIDKLFPEWCTLIQTFMENYNHYLEPRIQAHDYKSAIEHQMFTKSSFNFRFFALALAQHYGLPSNGLDVTSNLDVALFFALSEFGKSSNQEWTDIRRAKKGQSDSVIYVFSQRPRFTLDFEACKPEGFPTIRPDAQSAHFLHTSWGLSINSSARNLYLAFYLDPLGDYGHIPTVKELFPMDDPFGSFLQQMNSRQLPDDIAKFIRYFRWVI